MISATWCEIEKIIWNQIRAFGLNFENNLIKY